MSFSSEVKNEICALANERKCCNKALLSGAFALFNTVSDKQIKMTTENASVARYLNLLIKETFKADTDISFRKSSKSKGFTIEITDEKIIKEISETIGLVNPKTGQIAANINNNLVLNDCCKCAALRGAFLVAGSISDPAKGYHFEIACHREKQIKDLFWIFSSLDIEPKIVERGSNYVLYIKEKEKVADTLNILGSKQMFFKIHDIMMEKELRNELNRRQNFEQANLDKTLNAAVVQTNAIKKIMETNRFSMLPDNLKELASLRMEYPDVSLNELASMLSENITRSGINHRLKKIVEFADKIKEV
ncbi:MAG: DNA-binding protein WhiA [Clostridia bacterium]|nr:DNA-binding protein WhiA [Clostridia bacterium]